MENDDQMWTPRAKAMTRDEAIELARKKAMARPQSYCVEPFEPHEWVINAILAAANGER